MKKIILYTLLCICMGLFLISCGKAESSAPPSLEDAMATFYHNNIAVYPEQNAATLYTAAGAENATEFSVDNENVIIYEFGSEESLQAYMDSTKAPAYPVVSGLLMLDTQSERAKEIFSTSIEGDAEKWPINVTEASLDELYTSTDTCEVTFEDVAIPLDISDDVTLTPVDGSTYIGMHFSLKNISSEEADIEDLINASYNYGGFRYPGNVRVYKEDSATWEYTMMLEPGETYDVRIFVIVPEGILTDEQPVNAEVSAGGRRLTYKVR